ncbi:MAG: hypothetical protein WC428_06795 [Candidatus Paceibacterota bacterium]
MKLTIGKTNIVDMLSKHNGEYCRLEFKIDSKKYIASCGGVINATHDNVPYNPLTDMDCGTDAMIGRVK